MNIFVIGGVTVLDGDPSKQEQEARLSVLMEQAGKDIVERGHNLLVCSPFPGSADAAAVRGAAKVIPDQGPIVEFHFPDSADVLDQLKHLCEELHLERFQHFVHFPLKVGGSKGELSTHAWLLAQLAAMDRSHAIIAVGGKTDASASLLLALAESRNKELLPFTFLGGAAADSYERLRDFGTNCWTGSGRTLRSCTTTSV